MFVMPVVFLILMKVDPMSVFVPVGSSLLAASFVFAQSVQTFMVSMIFVLVTHPYDEGDTVVINDSGYKVDHISVFSTAFVFTASKMRVYIPHTVYVLVTVAVGAVPLTTTHCQACHPKHFQLHAQQPCASDGVGVCGPASDPAAAGGCERPRHQVHAHGKQGGLASTRGPVLHCRRCAGTYCHHVPALASPQACGSCSLRDRPLDLQPDDGKVCIKVFGATWVSWRARGAVFKVQSGLTLALTNALSELNIKHDRAPTKVELEQLPPASAAHTGVSDDE